MVIPQPTIQEDTKIQLIEKLTDQKMNAVAAQAGAYATANQEGITYHNGRIAAFKRAIKVVEEMLNEP